MENRCRVAGKSAKANAKTPVLHDITNRPPAGYGAMIPKCTPRTELPFDLIAKIIATAGPSDDPSIVLLPGIRGDTLRSLLAQQRRGVPSARNLKVHAQVSEVRLRFVNWIMTSWWLRAETVFLTVSIIDRYLAENAVQGRLFGLVAIAALHIATKLEEPSEPPVDDLLAAMDYAYTQQELARMEEVMVSRMDQAASPTAAHLLPFFLEAMWGWQCSSHVYHVSSSVAAFAEDAAIHKTKTAQDVARDELAFWFTKLSLFELRTVCFAPSKVAASAVLLSNRIYDLQQEWPAALARLTGHSKSELGDCVVLMERHWKTRRC